MNSRLKGLENPSLEHNLSSLDYFFFQGDPIMEYFDKLFGERLSLSAQTLLFLQQTAFVPQKTFELLACSIKHTKLQT